MLKFPKNIWGDLLFISQALLRPNAKRGLYSAHMGFKNMGDEVLREAIYKTFGDEIIWARERGKLLRCLEKFRLFKFDLAMLGGGTLLLDAWSSLQQLHQSGAPFCVVFGTGATDAEFWKQRKGFRGEDQDWVAFVDQCAFVGLRGPLSRQILVQKGCRNAIEVIGDPALYFTKAISARKLRRKKIGLNIGTTKIQNNVDLVWGWDEGLFFKKFAEFTRDLVDGGWEVEFIPVCTEDVMPTREVVRLSGRGDKIKIFKNYFSLEKTLDKLEEFDVFVGEKLHSVVLSYCANTPAVMVEYRPKCRDFMESIEMSDFVLRTDNFSPDIALRLVAKIYDELETYRDKCHSICMQYKQLQITSAQNILATVHKGR